MLITFRSKAGADVLMLSQHAAPLLHAAGKDITGEVPERGVFTPEQLPAAIAGIEKAVHLAPKAADEDDDDKGSHASGGGVTLQQRAYPLLDLMRKSQAQGATLMWEAGSGY
jgi:hypothetical protein